MSRVARQGRSQVGWLGSILLVLSLTACGQSNPRSNDPAAGQKVESQLTFQDITLEQADDRGQLLWRVKAKRARYTNDKKIAEISNPSGELYQDGKLVFRLSAKQGAVQQDGDQIFLKGDIVAKDTQDGMVLRGQELEWRPKEDLLIVRKQLTGTHPRMQAEAQEAHAFSRDRRLELIGNVRATTKNPDLRLQTEHLVWNLAVQQIISDRPTRIVRYIQSAPTDQATGNQATLNLKTQVATLNQQAQINLANPPVQINSSILQWNLAQQTVVSPRPLQVQHRQQQVALKANQGRLNLGERVFYLQGQVEGQGQRNGAFLQSDALTWNIPTEELHAQGNVIYRQAKPPLYLRGPEAIGKLNQQTIRVQGTGGPVVTEIDPQSLP